MSALAGRLLPLALTLLGSSCVEELSLGISPLAAQRDAQVPRDAAPEPDASSGAGDGGSGPCQPDQCQIMVFLLPCSVEQFECRRSEETGTCEWHCPQLDVIRRVPEAGLSR